MPLEDPFILTEEGNPPGMKESVWEDSLLLAQEDTIFNPVTNVTSVYPTQVP